MQQLTTTVGGGIRSGKLSTNYCTTNLLHPYLPLTQVCHLLTALLLSSPIKYLNFVVCPLLASSNPTMTSPHLPSPSATPPVFSTFTPASVSEIHKILPNCPTKQSDSDPIRTWLLKECASVLVPTITNTVNLSLTSGQFHPILKESVISPLLKKFTLDND